jgi:hypothetical protein
MHHLSCGKWGGAAVFSASDGSLVASTKPTLGSETPYSTVAAVGDVDRDGFDDYAMGSAPLMPDAGIGDHVEIRSGSTGALLYALPEAWASRAKAL